MNNGKHGQGTHCTKMGADKAEFAKEGTFFHEQISFPEIFC